MNRKLRFVILSLLLCLLLITIISLTNIFNKRQNDIKIGETRIYEKLL